MIKQRIAELGADRAARRRRAVRATMQAETESWRKIVQNSGIHKQG